MPRDMTATGRYPPNPRFPPIAFYSAVRLGDPEQLALIMETDPYFITQDNGAGAPLHFATTYKQLDTIHHLLNNGAEINQRDDRGFTPLHRAAYLAQYDGYLEIYEYLLSRGADPSIKTEDYDKYLDPGCKLPIEVALDDEDLRNRLRALNVKYKSVPKVRVPHKDTGCWWTLYDYGLDSVKKWAADYVHPYPEELRRQKDAVERKQLKEEAKKRKAAAAALGPAAAAPKPVANTPVAFVFPGQGSQALGMLNESKDLPAVKVMLAKAKEILGYDLLQLIVDGPKEKLDSTEFAQPALYVAGLAAVERLRASEPAVVASASSCAGLSLGEYSALAFAGAISFEDGLKIVKLRGENMAAAAKLGEPHGMLSIIGVSDVDIENICKQVREKLGGNVVCQMANYLFPQGRVISGHHSALDKAMELANQKGALKTIKLAVSGAFHTPLMQPARDNLTKVLSEVTFSTPRIPVYSNVTAKPFVASEMPTLLARQLVEPVQWETTLRSLIESGKTQLFEVGPGSQIKAMVKRLDPGVWKAFKNVSA